MKLDRVNHSDFVDGAEIPRVCLSPSNTVATLMKRHFLVAAVLAKPARCRDAELDTFRDASRPHHTPQLVRATDAFFCFSYPKLRPWHLFIDPKSADLKLRPCPLFIDPSVEEPEIFTRRHRPAPAAADLHLVMAVGHLQRPQQPLDHTYPCRLCVFVCSCHMSCV